MYIYEDHLSGGLYASDDELDYEQLHCEQCGDTDWLIGFAETRKEAWDLLKDDTNIEGSGGWDYEYVMEFINKHWEE